MNNDVVPMLPEVVDEILAEYLDALDRGHAPTRQDLLARYPQQAEELSRFLDDLSYLSPTPCRAEPADGTLAIPSDPEAVANLRATSALEATVANALTDADVASASLVETMPLGGVFGEYDLLDLVARGGMGVVFRARHRKLDRIVALKMILAGQLASPSDIERFRAEAQAAACLDHPGIVPVYEVGEHNGLHYFTMAFIEGESLADRLRDGPLDCRLAARLVRDLAAAIEYAHSQGIVHRDLKPANILIDGPGHAKLTDFGLAKRVQGAGELTGTGQILGTPTYMSPEQAQGVGDVTAASDIYGLGALLFALATGRPPFQAATPLETIAQVVAAEPPRLRALNPSVPRDLETICLKCLEKSPGKRYATAAGLAADLDRFLEDRPILARPVGMIEKAYRWYHRRPVIGTLAATLAALLIAVPVLLGFFLMEAEARAKLEADGHVKEKDAREKVEQAHDKTKLAERERTKQLFQAYVNEAAARRTSPRAGRRFDSLDRIVAARELADELKLPAEDYTRLRSEAISALSLVDLQATTKGPGWVRSFDTYSFEFADGNDSYLAWDKPNGLLIRRVTDNRILHRLPVEKADRADTYPRLSPDNRFVLTLTNGQLAVWQIDAAKPAKIASRNDVLHAAFAPDKPEIIVLTRTRELVILPVDGKAKPKSIRIPEIMNQPNTSQWYHPCQPGPVRQVAVGGLNRVYIVDLGTAKITTSFETPGNVEHLAWSRDGATIAVGQKDFGVILFQPATKSLRIVKTTLGGPETVAFDPSGKFLIVSNDWTSHSMLLNVDQGAVELRFHNSELTDAGTASRGEYENWWWWRGALDTPHRALSLRSEDGMTGEMAIHPVGRLLATTTHLGVALTDIGTGKALGLLPGGPCRFPCFDSAGNLYALKLVDNVHPPHRWPVAVRGNGYQIGAPERLATPHAHGLDVSQDGRTVAVSTWNRAMTLDRQTGKIVLSDPQAGARLVAVSPDGLQVASFGWDAGSDGFRVWEAKTGKLIHVFRKGLLGLGRFTPDGKHLVHRATGEKELLLWSASDWKMLRKLGSPGEFALSPDSQYIAVAELNGKARLTRISDGALIARFDAPGEEYLKGMAFSPDGRFLVATTIERNKHHVWDLWKLRRQLAKLKLDWEKEPAPKDTAVSDPIIVEIAPQQPKP